MPEYLKKQLKILKIHKCDLTIASKIVHSTFQSLTYLTIGHNNLGPEWRYVPEQYPQLTILDICTNELGPIWGFYDIKSLPFTYLNISNNRLYEIILPELPELHTLILRYNHLHRSIKLPKSPLKKLSLAFNPIIHKNNQYTAYCHGNYVTYSHVDLTLTISYPNLYSSIPQTPIDILYPNLISLDLQGCSLKNFILHDMPLLKKLNISGYNTKAPVDLCLPKMPNLLTLAMSHDDYHNINWYKEIISSLPKLTLFILLNQNEPTLIPKDLEHLSFHQYNLQSAIGGKACELLNARSNVHVNKIYKRVPMILDPLIEPEWSNSIFDELPNEMLCYIFGLAENPIIIGHVCRLFYWCVWTTVTAKIRTDCSDRRALFHVLLEPK
jgi:hypothetical protein